MCASDIVIEMYLKYENRVYGYIIQYIVFILYILFLDTDSFFY